MDRTQRDGTGRYSSSYSFQQAFKKQLKLPRSGSGALDVHATSRSFEAFAEGFSRHYRNKAFDGDLTYIDNWFKNEWQKEWKKRQSERDSESEGGGGDCP